MTVRLKRPSWDEYFINLAKVVKTRADCLRRQVGSVIVKDFRIISTGYNGTPHKIKNCSQGGCLRCKKRDKGEINWYEYEESCICIHAEQNAICQAAKLGISIEGATLYCRMTPCRTCAMIIINSGITRVVVERKYQRGQESEEMFKQASVELVIINDELQKY